MKKLTYNDFADYLIALSNQSQNLISNMKLQKMLFYIYAWNLAKFKEPLFEAEFQAWVHGPVIPKLYSQYKVFSWLPIEKKLDEDKTINKIESNLEKDHLELFNEVVREYFGESAYSLESLVHSEDPWIIARKGLAKDEISNEVISDKSIIDYYSKNLVLDGQEV